MNELVGLLNNSLFMALPCGLQVIDGLIQRLQSSLGSFASGSQVGGPGGSSRASTPRQGAGGTAAFNTGCRGAGLKQTSATRSSTPLLLRRTTTPTTTCRWAVQVPPPSSRSGLQTHTAGRQCVANTHVVRQWALNRHVVEHIMGETARVMGCSASPSLAYPPPTHPPTHQPTNPTPPPPLQFIAGFANMRARNYAIPEVGGWGGTQVRRSLLCGPRWPCFTGGRPACQSAGCLEI